MKVHSGYYDRSAILWKYLEMEFAKKLPFKGHEELRAFQIHRSYDNVNKRISISAKTLVDFRMVTLMDRLNAHLGGVCTPCDNKVFIANTNIFVVRRAFLHKCTTMSMYWDALSIK